MSNPSWPLLCSLVAVLACTTDEPTAAPPEPAAEQPTSPFFTQAELASDPTARQVSGQLACASPTGDWSIEVYAIPLGDQGRAPDVLPSGGPLTSAPVAEDGVFSLLVPPGVRRLLIGRHASGGLAWGDPHGRYTEVVNDVINLVLTCGIIPSPSPDGSKMAAQGEQVLEVLVFEPSAGEADAIANNQAWVDAVPAAPRVDVWGRASEDFGNRETVSRIRARYQNQLSEEELNLLLPMLYQLSDQPGSADAFVEDTIRSREAEANARSEVSLPPSLPEVR